MPVNLGLDDEVNEVSKQFLSGFRGRVETLLERAVRSDRNPFNDAATASAEQTVAVKTGTVIAFAGLNAPHGYLECNGAEVSKTQYSALAAAIGTTYGTASVGMTRLPNAKQAAIAGAGGTRVAGVGTALGNRFENNTTSLTVANLPEHFHGIGSISEEDPGHVHDVTAYPNFGIAAPTNWIQGTGGGSNADGGGIESDGGGSFERQWDAGIDYGRGSTWQRASDYGTNIYQREERGDGASSNPSAPGEIPAAARTNFRTVLFGPNAGAVQPTDTTKRDALIGTAIAIGAPLSAGASLIIGGGSVIGGFGATVGTGIGSYLGSGLTQRFVPEEDVENIFRGFYNRDGTARTDTAPTPTPGSGIRDQAPVPPAGINPTPTDPNRTNAPAPSYFYFGGGTQQTAKQANRVRASGVQDIAPPTSIGNIPGQIGGGSSPAPTTPGSTPSTGGNTPNNAPPGAGTKPAEDKSTAPPVATRENPFDTTFLSDSQREQFNESIEDFYEDYAVTLRQTGGASFGTFIGSPGVSYGKVDARATTLVAGSHTHTVSGEMDTTGGSGLLGTLQPSIALMWIIKT